MRRSLTLFVVALSLLSWAGGALADPLIINNVSTEALLRSAITSANAHGDAVTINMTASSSFTIGSMMPVMTNPYGITINGNGSAISGGSTSNTTGDRIFFIGVSAGEVGGSLVSTASAVYNLNNLTLQNGNARGGNGGNGNQRGGGGGAGLGGAIFLNAGTLNLSGVDLAGNRAVGGNGGNGSGSSGRGAGGGGMGGTGAGATTSGGGGGGGFGIGANGGVTTSGGSAGKFTGGLAGGNGSQGAAGGSDGGGGGGGGSSGVGGGGGLVGATQQTGGFGGGGGGSYNNTAGGNGGFGGGGGGGAGGGGGGNGNFGGGGGGRSSGQGNNNGFGGGYGGRSGTNVQAGGGGGLGAGGALFVRQGATLNITGGGLSGGSVTGGNGGSGGNTITPAAGSAIGSAIFLAGSASYTVSSGTVTIADTIGGGVDTQITGGFAKKGAGILELTAANTYVGGTSIDAGLLLANNSTGSATGNGIVTVKNTGTLGGSGFITGAVTVKSGGSIAPGNSPGILTVTGNTVFESGGIFNVQLDGATAGTEYDRLNVVGLVTVTDAILTGTVGYAASAADKLFILTNDGSDGITGTFAGLAEGGTVNLGTYTALITYQGNSATGDLTGGNDIALYSFAVIPEPATMALLAMGGVALMIRRRRRA